MSMSKTLPRAAGASPREPHMARDSLSAPGTSRSAGITDTQLLRSGIPMDTQQELKMLNWYKLANEAAMKAALVKHKRFKEVPRYNPAAERVRQRGTWLEQVIAEEQNKPLELETAKYKALMMKEAAEREADALKTKERHLKITKLKEEIKEKEQRKLRYRKFLAEQEAQRRKAGTSSLDSIYGQEEGEEIEVGMSADVLASLNSLEQLEERVQTIILDDQSKAPGAIVLDLSVAAKVTFVKRRTEPRLNQPSQILYTAKVVPSTSVRREALHARNTYFAMDVPEHVMEHMQQIEHARALDEERSRHSLGGTSKSRRSVSPKDKTLEEVKAQYKADAARQQLIKEEEGERHRAEQERMDEVIKEWLRGRSRRELKREKKMRDIMRADRRFLSQLQVSKTDKGPLSNPLENANAPPSGAGWNPNLEYKPSTVNDYNTEDMDWKLDVLLQQQRQMEKWKSKKA